MHFYSIHVIAEFNLSGSEIICRQIDVILSLLLCETVYCKSPKSHVTPPELKKNLHGIVHQDAERTKS